MVIGYVKLMRPVNCLMTSVAVFIGGLLVSAAAPFPWLDRIAIAMGAAFMIAGAGNAINDYLDVDADKINRPRRPIPSGMVYKRSALVFSITLFLIGITLAGIINWVTFAIAILNSFILIIYSTHLQNKMFMGNVAISYLVASGFLFGGAALNGVALPFMLALLAGLSNMSREIVKDLEDMEGDRLSFLKRMAKNTIKKVVPSIADRFGFDGKTARLKYTSRTLSTFAVLFILLTIAVSPLPYAFGILGMGYLIMLIPTVIVFLLAAVITAKASSKRHYKRTSKLIKTGMFLGLMAFIVGVLI